MTKESDELKTMFTEFEAQQVLKLQGFTVFENGSKSYCDLLTIDIDKINKRFENDISRTKKGLQDLQKIKDENFKNMMDYFLSKIK